MKASPVVKKVIEPRQRKDGKCVNPKCRKTIPLVGLRNGDPFCSSDCCKKHYGLNGGS